MGAIKRYSLPILSGFLLAMPWYGFTGLIAMVALVPLLLFISSPNDHSLRSLPQATIGFFITFFIWISLSIWCIAQVSIVGAVAIILLNTLLMTLISSFIYRFTQRCSTIYRIALLVSVWISFEFFQYRWEIALPWMNLGHALANEIHLIQWYEFTGVLGGSFWLLLVNIALVSLLNAWMSQKLLSIRILMISVLIAAPMLLSVSILNRYTENADPVRIAILQPNIDPFHDKFAAGKESQIVSDLLDLAKQASEFNPMLYVAPETAIPTIDERSDDQQPSIDSIQQFLKHDSCHAAMVVGAITFKEYHPNDQLPHYSRLDSLGKRYNLFNSALTILDSGDIQFYHKNILVAGVEKMPWVTQFPILERWTIDLGGVSGTLGSEKTETVHCANKCSYVVPICYESVFGEYVSTLLNKKAQFIIVLTNDGWWNQTPGYRQHLMISRLRAIELRRSLVRSANTGISALINQKGEIVSQTDWWTKTYLVGEINRNDRETFYAKHGDWLGRIAIVLSVILIVVEMLFRLRKKNRIKSNCENPEYQDLSALSL